MSSRLPIVFVVSLFLFASVFWGANTTHASQSEGQIAASVHGHGTLTRCTGVPCEEAQFIDQISITAYLDDFGNAHGKATWTEVIHSVSADPSGDYPPGPGYSGYPWQLDVLELEVNSNTATVKSSVVSSPQNPSDVGIVVIFEIVDTDTAFPDQLGVEIDGQFVDPPMDILAGNFTIWSTPIP